MPVTPATMTTTDTAAAWLPAEYANLIVQPLEAESVAIQAAGSMRASAASNSIRVPVIAEDPSASFVAEGSEIPVSQARLGEVADTFHKLAGLTVISHELVADSDPAVADQVLKGLGRDMAKKLDAAFFSTRGEDTIAPKGLGDVAGVNTIAAGKAFTNADPFTAAIYAAEGEGATLSAFVANPADALAIATAKESANSQRPLLGADPTLPTRRLVQGVPLLTSPAVTKGTVWGIPGGGRITIAVREDVELEKSDQIFFTSDRIAVRGRMRVAFLYPHEKAVQKITLSA